MRRMTQGTATGYDKSQRRPSRLYDPISVQQRGIITKRLFTSGGCRVLQAINGLSSAKVMLDGAGGNLTGLAAQVRLTGAYMLQLIGFDFLQPSTVQLTSQPVFLQATTTPCGNGVNGGEKFRRVTQQVNLRNFLTRPW